MYKNLKKVNFLDTQQFADLQIKIIEVFDALNDYKVDLSKEERKTLRVFSTGRAGYVNKVERAIEFYKDALPANYNMEKIGEFKTIHDDLASLLGALAKLTERVSDMDFVVRHVIMNSADEAYSYLRASKDFNNDMDNQVIEDLEAFNKKGKKQKTDATVKPTDNDSGNDTNNPDPNDNNTNDDIK